ncbi:hypothetical protein ACLUUI_00800 [Enterobacterales bacterium AW_CKDN230030176-1A_HGKHYDSX7]
MKAPREKGQKKEGGMDKVTPKDRPSRMTPGRRRKEVGSRRKQPRAEHPVAD